MVGRKALTLNERIIPVSIGLTEVILDKINKATRNSGERSQFIRSAIEEKLKREDKKKRSKKR